MYPNDSLRVSANIQFKNPVPTDISFLYDFIHLIQQSWILPDKRDLACNTLSSTLCYA